MKVLTVVGARPQFIKAAVLSKELARQGCTECMVHTGQHYDHNMSRIFFDGLDMREPDHYLEVGSASHAIQTANMMVHLEPVIESEQPDWVLVYGDTNTTLAGSLVAAKLRIPLGHVEAGLRSFNREMPEEINRIVADHVASAHFAPTKLAVKHLADEGIIESVHLVGDLMVDLANLTVQQLPEPPEILTRLKLARGAYGVVTIHRAGNTDNAETFEQILEGLSRIEYPIIFPVHPRTSKLLRSMSLKAIPRNIRPCEPLSYVEMIALQAHARMIFTDSGGIQKEALSLGVPCVTLRRETEWPETLQSGWNTLAGSNPAVIATQGMRLRPTVVPAPCYGDGTSAFRITQVLMTGAPLPQAVA